MYLRWESGKQSKAMDLFNFYRWVIVRINSVSHKEEVYKNSTTIEKSDHGFLCRSNVKYFILNN